MTLEISSTTIGYGRLEVLRAVNAAAQRGRITAVIGSNAAGKTTLLRCAAGLLRPIAGSVSLDDERVHAMPPRRLAQRIAYVAQRPRVSGGLTVRSVVELGRYALSNDRQAIDRAIDRLDLAAVAEQRFATLSVGQQQRVVLARALAQFRPNGVLVLDEPTAALDLSHTRELVALLRELAEDGAMILCALHDLSLAAAIADDVWLVHERQIESGPVGQIMQPGRLGSVFGVDFACIEGPGGQELLYADIAPGAYTHKP